MQGPVLFLFPLAGLATLWGGVWAESGVVAAQQYIADFLLWCTIVIAYLLRGE